MQKSTLSMAWSLLDRRERRNIWIVVAVSVLSALAATAMVGSIMPFLTVLSDPERIRQNDWLSWAYESGGFESTRGFLIALGLTSVAVIVLANVLQILRVYTLTRYAFMRGHTLSHRLMSSYLRRPYAYFALHNSGDMGTKVLSESQQVVAKFLRPAVEIFAAATTIAALVALLLAVEPVISLIVFSAIGAVYATALLLARPLVRRLGVARAAANAKRFRIANEAFGGIKDIKILGRERSYLNRYATPSILMARSMAKVTAIGQMPQYIMHAVAFAGLILLCLVLMGPMPENGEPGNAMADILPTIGFMAFAGQRMIPELSRLYQSLTQISYGRSAVLAVYEDMTAETETDRLPKTLPAPLGLSREIVFDAVSYHYDSQGKAGVTELSFRIAAGERVGIVGTTGAGKSTVANLLLGLYQPSSGTLMVDGAAIDQGNLRAWQQTIGYVPQEIFLTDASVRANIALGVPDKEIDEDRVRHAARIAQIEEFVLTELDEGYDTIVGERGVRLSGGQRQRIGIARALYNDGDFILLDEATSALDNTTEAEVMNAIEGLPGDKTIVMIAHRLTTLKSCDRILVLEAGAISGFDSWDVLLKENRVFRSLAESAQTNKFDLAG